MGEKTGKRELILNAAREVFFEKGYHSATSEEIAKRAGVGKGTLYQYFESKQDIFLEMHRLYIEQYGEQIGACIDEASSIEENLRRIVQFHMKNIQNMVQYSIRIIAEFPMPTAKDARDDELLMQTKNRIETVLQRLLLTGQQRGEIREINTKFMIHYIMGVFMGIAHMIVAQELSEDEKQQVEEEIVQCVLYGIVQQPVK